MDRDSQQPVDDDIGVAPDGRGEVGVDGAGQAVVGEQRLLNSAAGEVHSLEND